MGVMYAYGFSSLNSRISQNNSVPLSGIVGGPNIPRSLLPL